MFFHQMFDHPDLNIKEVDDIIQGVPKKATIKSFDFEPFFWYFGHLLTILDTVQSVQMGPDVCNVYKIVKRCPKYQKGSKVEKFYCHFFWHPVDDQEHTP